MEYINGAPRSNDGIPDVLVLIGHSKEHLFDEPFAEFLRLVSKDPNLKVSGFGEIAELVAPTEVAS